MKNLIRLVRKCLEKDKSWHKLTKGMPNKVDYHLEVIDDLW